ncbi:MAG: hypothetical protein ALECFALPRED_004492 [Alectoria fallacina]|uniref:Uncharacterized protein n=1 Tax=Alectoria fallacina TaxID=1903189 RepID=A0A8H3ISG0_9LECA|nr:MAG: hypothetical protein ALECFALPRED_004492 [Alectoria fallacina]
MNNGVDEAHRGIMFCHILKRLRPICNHIFCHRNISSTTEPPKFNTAQSSSLISSSGSSSSFIGNAFTFTRTSGKMTPTTSFSSSRETSASTTSAFPNPRENDPISGEADEGPQASTDAGEDRATQDKPPNTPDKMVEGDHSVYCWTCDHYSASVKEHQTHVKTSPRHFCCRYCDDGVEVAGAYFLRAHYEKCHPSLYCSVCDRLFATIEERSVHIKTSPLHFCCQNCDDVVDFSNVFSLRQHYRDCHPLLSCAACYDHFPTVAKLSAHMQEAHYPCDGCHEYFSEPRYLKYHRMTCKKVHPPLPCDGCHELFYNPTILKWHREICEKVNPPHRCDGCHASFTNPTSLKWHREICDKVNFPHRCEGCHEGFVNPAFLERHRKSCKKVNPPKKSKMPQNHYATLGISPRSSQEQIVKAAKEMRVKVHPDRLKRQGGLTKEQEEKIDVEAALVGQAADILSDPLSRAKYDRKLRG